MSAMGSFKAKTFIKLLSGTKNKDGKEKKVLDIEKLKLNPTDSQLLLTTWSVC